MSVLVAGTNLVRMDEPCFGLFELVQQSPGSKGFRRYQILLVVRDDRVSEFRRDLGPASSFTAPEFRIPGGVREGRKIYIEHTVGELADIADLQRNGYFDQPEIVPTDLIGGYHDHVDQVKKHRTKASHFGPLHRVQRS